MAEEKTEAPTAKKKKDSRKEGQVPRTQELGGYATLLAFALLLDFAAGHELRALANLMRECLRAVQSADLEAALELAHALGDELRERCAGDVLEAAALGDHDSLVWRAWL